jgi:hypothetical protein
MLGLSSADERPSPQIPGANWSSYDTIIVHDPAVGVNMFYRDTDIHHLLISDQTIPCNAAPPDRGCLVNPKLKPVFRSAEMGEAERLRERQ